MIRRWLVPLLSTLVTLPSLAAEPPRVTGRVLGPGDAPLAEVTVSLVPSKDALDELLAATRDPAAEEPVRTRTDAEGRFAVSAPQAGMWRVRLEAPGYVPAEAALRPLIEATVLEDARLRPDTGLTVRVVGADGTPLSGADVAVAPARARRFGSAEWSTPTLRGTTGADGTLRLAHADREEVTVVALAAGRAPARVAGVRGSAARVQTEAGERRSLRLVSPDGGAVGGALVAVGDPALPVGLADDEGRLEVVLRRGVAIETSAIHAEGRRASARLEPAGDAETPLRLVVPERLALVGRLIDAESRRPLAGGVVWDTRDPDRAVRSDGAGGFVIAGAAGRRFELTAGAPGYLSAEPFGFQLHDDGRPGPTLALQPAAALAGSVVDADGRPVVGAEVELSVRPTPGLMRIEIGRGSRRPRALTGPRGEFHLGSVDPEPSYDMKVTAEGFAPATQAVGGLEPRRTRTGLRVVLDAGHALVGRVVDGEGGPLVGASIRVEAAAPTGGGGMMRIVHGGGSAAVFEGTSGEEGRFRVEGLPAGRFDVEAARRGFARRRLPGVEVGAVEGPTEVGEIALAPGETVDGFVHDGDGRPVEGVEVRLGETGGGGMVMVMAGPGPGPADEEPAALTDPSGWFSVADLAPGERYSLGFRRTGYVSADAAVEVPRAEPVEIRLEPASDVSGTVLDPGGEPIAGARVLLRRTRTMEIGNNAMAMVMMTDATSDQGGRFLFEDQEPGTISLSAVASGFQEARRDDLEIPRGADLEGVDLPLPAGAILEGRVLAPDGGAAIGASVGSVGGGEGPDAMVRQLDRVGVDGNGYYRLEGLEPGPISIEAVHDDYPRVVRDVQLREGRNALDLAFAGGHEVSGRVVDSGGTPLPEAAVMLRSAGRAWGGPTTTSRGDGTFVLPGVRDGEYRLSAEAEGFAPSAGDLAVTVAGEPVAGLELRLDAGGSVFGRVGGLAPERFADVVVVAQGDGPARGGEAAVDYEGNFRIEHLAPGDYGVTARLGDSGRQAAGRVLLEPGATEARVDLEFGAGLTLSGTAAQGEQPVVGATVYAEGLEIDHTGWSQTDSTGRFSIEGLERGPYRVHVRNFQTGLAHSERVEVATSREIRLELPTATVGGRVLDAADRAPLAGVSITLDDPTAAGRAGIPVHTTTTDLDGRFRLSGIADGTWQLTAARKGYAAAVQPVAVQFDRGTDDLDIAMDATEGLTIEVRLPSGVPPDTASVAVLDAAGSALLSGSYTTGENGRVRLSSVPAGEWELIVAAAGAATSTLAVRAPGPPAGIQLQPPTSLRVEVPELLGSTTLATVTLRDAAGRPFRTIGWTSQTRAEWRMEGGRIEFGSLAPGAWTATVEAPDGRRWSATATTVVGATATLSLE